MNEFSWDCSVSIFKNLLILKQLGLAVGLPFGGLFILLLFIKAYNGVFMLAAAFVLAFIIIRIVFRGTYDVRYTLNKKGILCRNSEGQGKRVRRLSTITYFLGLLKGNCTAAGIGLLSASSVNISIQWKNIRRVKYKENQRLIMIYAGFNQNIALFCSGENYSDVKQYVEKMIK